MSSSRFLSNTLRAVLTSSRWLDWGPHRRFGPFPLLDLLLEPTVGIGQFGRALLNQLLQLAMVLLQGLLGLLAGR